MEQFYAAVERPKEPHFLIVNLLPHLLRVLLQFRERPAHVLGEHGHEAVQERVFRTEILPAIPLRPAEDAAQYVVPALVADPGAVGEGKGERAEVVGDDAVGRVGVVVEDAAVGPGAGRGSEWPRRSA